MNNKTIIEFGFVSYEESWRSRRVISAEADTLVDPYNSSAAFSWHEAEFNNCRFVMFLKKVYEKVRILLRT